MRNHRQSWISILIFASAIVMMVYGNYRGEVPIVFNKAVHICLECIGLG